MWFKFAPGVSGITVERQQFNIEFTDERGDNYFRAPAHFAPRILIVPGFAQVTPDGAPDDLPKEMPEQEAAIAELGRENGALKDTIGDLRSDLIAASKQVAVLAQERDEALKRVAELEAKVAELEEDDEDAPAAVVPLPARKAK